MNFPNNFSFESIYLLWLVLGMVHRNIFPKSNVKMDVKIYEVMDDVKAC